MSVSTHPRPQLARENWTNLNGRWAFGIGDSADSITKQITVPYAPETPASGIEAKGYFNTCWYKRPIDTPKLAAGDRLILHFEAADYTTRVWVNGQFAGEHEGGYTRFSFDITDAVAGKTTSEILVRCDDDPLDLSKPRGKQDWQPEAHAIWYPRTTGLWQTVWTEVVPAARISGLRWRADVPSWSIRMDAATLNAPAGARLRVQLRIGDRSLADDTFAINDQLAVRTFHLLDGGIDTVRDELYWSPNRPKLIDATLTLQDAAGETIDTVHSYTAMRSVAIDGDRFMINGLATPLRLVLDQGYWPDTGLTPPDDAAIIKDIELLKAMGFNGVRKHQKIESERFLYFADKMGLFVWEEMPSAYAFSPNTQRRVTNQWIAAIERDISHPCIITWVPLNESWGVPDIVSKEEQRDFARGLYYLTRSLDTSRPVISNDGWEMVETDLLNVHDYDHDPQRLQKRYDTVARPLTEILKHDRPGPRILVLDDNVVRGQPLLLTEFGGIALSEDTKATWGYSRATDSKDLGQRYSKLLDAVRKTPAFSGFCYTQFTDTYQEANGLLKMDRTPKFDLKLMSIATRGPNTPEEIKLLADAIAAAK